MAFLPQKGGGLFTIDPNASPEQIARKRELLAAMMPQFGNARYVGQGIGQLATGIAMGRQNRQLDKIENTNRDKISGMFDSLFSGGGSGSAPIAPQTGGPITSGPIDPNSPQGIAGDTMAALGKSPDQVIKAGLMQRGLPEHIADGFIMNFRDESGLNPAINETSPLVPGSRGGFGLAQWTGPRRVALEEFAASSGRSVSDPNVQLDFLMTELQGPEAKAAQSIMGAADAPSAAQAIARDFLRPAPEHLERRVAQYGGGSPSVAKAGGSMDIKTLAEIAASPYASAGQKAVAQALLQQQMQGMDPNYSLDLEKKRLEIDKLRNPQKYAGGAGSVGAQEILDDGTIIQSTPYGPRVFAPDGRELKGQEAAAAVRAARDYTVQNQTEIYRGRRSGTLGADIELGGEAAAVEDIAKASVEAGVGAWESYGKLQTSLANIDEAIAAIDSGAKSGIVYNMLPSVTEASAALESAMNRMGLDVVGAVTFGALSEGELKLALSTAVPQNLEPEQLRSWLVKRREAQAKAAAMAADAAQFLTVPGNTINDWIAKNRGEKAAQPSGAATHRYNPETGQIEAVQ